jgi:hypothetical protein
MTEITAQLEPWSDPIVEEVRAAREALLESCQLDLDTLARHLLELRETSGQRVVVLSPRRVRAEDGSKS